MAVQAIQKNSTNNSSRMSVAGSAAFGALAGYSLKWALPITSQEKDERYNLELNKINKEARQARTAEKELIFKTSEAEGADTFSKMSKKGTLTFSNIEKLKDPNKTAVRKLFNQINNAAFAVKAEGKQALSAFTKSIRPAGIFMVTGMGIASLIALTHNLSKQLDERSIEDLAIN